jgi:hypothetical protein
MSLKSLIRNKIISKQIGPRVGEDLTLTGEPRIYSTKWDFSVRHRSLNYHRNLQFKSLLKCVFPAYIGYKNGKSKVPVVLFVRFYVSPPASVDIPANKLKAESVPASDTHELGEYFLSFIEMLHGVLINSYRQIVKVDMEKFYSDNPRTVMQFMRYEAYVELANYNTLHAKTESQCENGQTGSLQCPTQRDAAVERLYS